MTTAADERFERRRSRLFGIAYRMLGSVSDAEDVVQDTWLACRSALERGLDHPNAYLDRAVTNRALNRLRDMMRRREDYVGPWLPEPLVMEDGPHEGVEQAETLSMAVLVVMDRMRPLERAAFVLCEAFDLTSAEAGALLDRSPAAVRQLCARARRALRAEPLSAATPAEHGAVVERFGEAVASGDLAAVVALLAPDVEFVSDGGGRATAARVPLLGVERVAGVLLKLAANTPDLEARPRLVNGRPGFLVESRTLGPSVYQFAVDDGRITHIWATLNPDKLTSLGRR